MYLEYLFYWFNGFPGMPTFELLARSTEFDIDSGVLRAINSRTEVRYHSALAVERVATYDAATNTYEWELGVSIIITVVNEDWPAVASIQARQPVRLPGAIVTATQTWLEEVFVSVLNRVPESNTPDLADLLKRMPMHQPDDQYVRALAQRCRGIYHRIFPHP